MTTIRIMSYNLQGCRDSSALCQTIEDWQADLITLQNVTNLSVCRRLASQMGYYLYTNTQESQSGVLVLLAKQAIKISRSYDLGSGASCMYSEHTDEECRFNLLNVEMNGRFFKRPEQIRKLLTLDLFKPNALQFPTLVLGDFFDSVWVSAHYQFQRKFIRLSPTFLRATYPSYFPILSRDRAYATDHIKLQAIHIDRSQLARKATLHLPIILDVEIQDNRVAVSAGHVLQSRMAIAPGPL
jgi:endonuclease/exonuclease/phosphatase family metal-dependent hydrolase